jgi:sugar O-acyltransferase (sialic acid O-acetyltransferase NeuD family)
MSISGEKRFLLFGGGGHAKSVIALLKECSLPIAGIVDLPERVGSFVSGVEVVSSEDIVSPKGFSGCFSLITIGSAGANNVKRARLFETLKLKGFTFGPAIVGKAVVAPSAILGSGTTVLNGCMINCDVSVAENCILNTGCIVEHDCTISAHSHISCGAIICGAAIIGRNVFIGAGATVLQGVSIGDNCVIGANATVIRDVDDDCVAIWTPAKVIKRVDSE